MGGNYINIKWTVEGMILVLKLISNKNQFLGFQNIFFNKKFLFASTYLVGRYGLIDRFLKQIRYFIIQDSRFVIFVHFKSHSLPCALLEI